MANTTFKAFPLIAASQAQKHITHNEALVMIDALFNNNAFNQVGVGGATADATNRLSVNSPASLFNNAGASHEMTINKNAAINDAAMAFKVGFSVRALFGLLGTNDFSVKTSPDGSVFNDSIVARSSDGTVSFPSGVLASGLTIEDDTDTTKKAQFLLSGITTGTTRQYTLPNLSAVLATTSNLSQTFTGTTVFSGATLTFGSGTAASTIGIGNGATIAAATKAINIGTAGVATSVTNVTIGSAVAGALGSATFNVDVFQKCLAPVNYAATATVTAAAVQNSVITYSGAAGTLTLPTGALLDALFTGLTVDRSQLFSLINTGTGAATFAPGTGGTIVGSAVVAAGTSGRFEMRKTAAATYIFYRIA